MEKGELRKTIKNSIIITLALVPVYFTGTMWSLIVLFALEDFKQIPHKAEGDE